MRRRRTGGEVEHDEENRRMRSRTEGGKGE